MYMCVQMMEHKVSMLASNQAPPPPHAIIKHEKKRGRGRAWKILITYWTWMTFFGHGFQLAVRVTHACNS